MSLLAPHNLPFLIAFGAAGVIALIALTGEGKALEGTGDFDAPDGLAVGGFGEVLSALFGLGKVPLMVWLACLLFIFGTIGMIGQGVLAGILGTPLPAPLGALLAGGAAMPINGLTVRPLAAIMPRDQENRLRAHGHRRRKDGDERLRAQASVLDGLMKELGLDGSNLSGLVKGAADAVDTPPPASPAPAKTAAAPKAIARDNDADDANGSKRRSN